MREFRNSLRRFDLTEQQWRVLRALNALGEVEVSDLARATYLLAPSLSRILRDLDDRTLIERRPDNDDLRRGLVRLAPGGAKLIARVSPESEAIYAEIARKFGAEQLATLQELLLNLERVMMEDAEASSGRQIV